MKHELPSLPYPMNAIEPHLSAETLEYHYGKHHRKYVDNLNSLIAGTEFEERPLERIITTAGPGPNLQQCGAGVESHLLLELSQSSGRREAGWWPKASH